MAIRSARPDDAPGIIAVLNPIIAAGGLTIMDQPLTLEDQRAFMRRFPERGVFNVALDQRSGTVLGLQSIEPFVESDDWPDHCEISTFIALDSLRRGIGRAITAQTLIEARAKDHRRILAHVRCDNPRALAFYQRIGFARIGHAVHHASGSGHAVPQFVLALELT